MPLIVPGESEDDERINRLVDCDLGVRRVYLSEQELALFVHECWFRLVCLVLKD